MKKLMTLAVCLMMIALLSGCGGDDDATKEGDTEADSGSGSEEDTTDETSDDEEAAASENDIVDTAVAAGGFETLVAAVTAAGLVDTLKGEGPFTVLAPTDEAFAALPEGTLEELLKPENKDKLVGILTYHVIPAKAMAADVVKMTSATTVQGTDVTIAVEGDVVKINGATVKTTDIVCSNGVIHVIDAVILPAE
jgi:uncharacterized surface protein with fasciclin (FAS1) repeats